MRPYYADDLVTLYHDDMREVVPTLDIRPDCIVTDPPYGMLRRPDRGVGEWDIWPKGWPSLAASVSNSMWCFGTLRTYLARSSEFSVWKFSHDAIWAKNRGSGATADRFPASHEIAAHWYRGRWADVYRSVPRVPAPRPIASKPPSTRAGRGIVGNTKLRSEWTEDGTRLALSVIQSPNLGGRGIHPTEKPVPVLDLLIRYACPPGGLVLDPFAGSGSTAVAARLSGRKAVLIEGDERYCEIIARRLAQDVLPIPGGGRSA